MPSSSTSSSTSTPRSSQARHRPELHFQRARVHWRLGDKAAQRADLERAVACAVALVGWFAWSRRLLPKGIAGILLAAVAAGSAVSTAALINPGTAAIASSSRPEFMSAHPR